MLLHRPHLGPLLVAALAACDAGSTPSASEPAGDPAPAVAPATADTEGPGETGDPEPDPEPPRKVPSGLDVGMTMASFDVVDPEDGSRRCQVCTIGAAPKLVAIGLPDDPAFIEDLRDLEAVLAKYGERAPQVFAVLAEARDEALLAPADPAALGEQAKTLRTRARLAMPVLVAATDDDPDPFTDHYRITKSRTLMLADGENTVTWSQTAPEHLGGLDLALSSLTGQTHPRPGSPGDSETTADE